MRIPLELSKWTASLPCRYEHGAFHLDTQSDLWDGCVGDLFLCGAGHPSRVLLTSPAIVGTVSTAISKLEPHCCAQDEHCACRPRVPA
jgi:hypothetical protein